MPHKKCEGNVCSLRVGGNGKFSTPDLLPRVEDIGKFGVLIGRVDGAHTSRVKNEFLYHAADVPLDRISVEASAVQPVIIVATTKLGFMPDNSPNGYLLNDHAQSYLILNSIGYLSIGASSRLLLVENTGSSVGGNLTFPFFLK